MALLFLPVDFVKFLVKTFSHLVNIKNFDFQF